MDDLREQLVNIDTTYDLGDRVTEQFLVPNYYIDRLVKFIKARDSKRDAYIIGEDDLEYHDPDCDQYRGLQYCYCPGKTSKVMNVLRVAQRQRAKDGDAAAA